MATHVTTVFICHVGGDPHANTTLVGAKALVEHLCIHKKGESQRFGLKGSRLVPLL